jgi:hypothetical protein
VTAAADDWRLQGQEAYLTEATLEWKPYTRYSESWAHDHCEFCSAKFSEAGSVASTLHEGYATPDKYRWICAACFEDFKERFRWRVLRRQAS